MSELAWLCLRLGCTAFGGPAVHLAMLEREVVQRRGWLGEQAFLDLLGATNLIPGPNSTEMVLHVGYQRGGWLGLIVAGLCFIGPAFLIVLGCAWLYQQYGTLPQLQGVLVALKPVMLALLVQVTWRLGRKALSSGRMWLLAAVAGAGVYSGLPPILVLLLAGLGGLLSVARDEMPPALLVPFSLPLASMTTSAVSGTQLFLVFLKIGSVLYGSGYVLLAFLRSDLVQRFGWLSEAQLLDAIAVGQVTPGPVFTTATFIGYILGSWSGACLATLGIFLPAFILVGATAPWIGRLRQHRTLAALLDGVNAASLVLLAVVTVQLGQVAIVDPATLIVAVISAAVLLFTSLSSMWLILVAILWGLLQA